MRNKNCIIGLIFCLFVSHDAVYSAEKDSVLTIVTFPVAEVPPNLSSDDLVDVRIRNYSEIFPSDLEEIIDNMPNKITFLLRTSELMELRTAVDYENTEKLISEVLKIVSKSPNAFCVTKIEKGVEKVVLRAKIVDITSSIIIQNKVFLSRTDFLKEGKDSPMHSKLKELAELITRTFVTPKKHMGLDSHRYFNYSTISSGVIVLGSALWWLKENSKVKDFDKKYIEALDTQEATKFRIKCEKSITRRKIAKTSMFISSVAFGVFLFRDFFCHHRKEKTINYSNSSSIKNTIKTIKFGMCTPINQEAISVYMMLYF